MKPLNDSLSILIVEDNDSARMGLVGVVNFKYPGTTIYSAENGRSGIECFKNYSPEIIITNISMPVLDGITMASEIRSLRAESIIIAITSFTDTEYLLNAIETGINHFVLKPLNYEKLFASIDKSIAAISQERQIRAQQEQIRILSKVVEQSHSSVVITDFNGKIEYVNPKFTKLTGYTSDEVVGKTPRIFQSGKTPMVVYSELWNTIKAGNEWKGELQNRKKNGEMYLESSSISPFFDEFGTVTQFITIKEDITELKKMENYLQKMQDVKIRTSHLAAMGELAAGVAHEINNPIQSIINYAEYIRSESSKDHKGIECASHIIMEGERIANIVRTLLAFARKNEDEKIKTDISDIIRDALILVNAQLRKNHIKTILNLNERSLPFVYADPQQILQVVLNLISNSIYALNKKYPSAVRNKCITISSSLINLDGKPMVEVAFLDNGIGIADQALHRVMDPFYTTKPNREGTGLGLSISHSIISNNSGTLKVESTEGEFTRIRFTLPEWRNT
jgi:PAS domain S-box-containing protein